MDLSRHEPTLKAIIAYKLVRAGLSLVGGVALAVLLALGLDAPVQRYAAEVQDHAASGLGLWLAGLFTSAVKPQHVLMAVGALVGDSVLTFFEGWSLHKSWSWGPWLVVGSSGVLLPWEIRALVEEVSWPRIALLAVNLGIVAYLVVRAIRHRLARQRAAGEHQDAEPAPAVAPPERQRHIAGV